MKTLLDDKDMKERQIEVIDEHWKTKQGDVDINAVGQVASSTAHIQETAECSQHLQTCPGLATPSSQMEEAPQNKTAQVVTPSEQEMKHPHQPTSAEDGKNKSNTIAMLEQKLDNVMNFIDCKLGDLIESHIKKAMNKGSEGEVRRESKRQEEECNNQSNDNRTETRQNWSNIQQRPPRQIIGVKEDRELQAGDRMAWIYVGQLKQSTREQHIIQYLTNNGVEGDIACEDLRSRGPHKAFKVGIPFESLADTTDPSFWPRGVRVRRFRFRRGHHREGYEEGASLEEHRDYAMERGRLGPY